MQLALLVSLLEVARAGSRTGLSYLIGDFSGEHIELERNGEECVLTVLGNAQAQFSEGEYLTQLMIRASDGTPLLDPQGVSINDAARYSVSLNNNVTRVTLHDCAKEGRYFRDGKAARVYAQRGGIDVQSAGYAGKDCQLKIERSDADGTVWGDVFGHSVGKLFDPYYLNPALAADANEAGCDVIFEANYTCANAKKIVRATVDEPVVIFECSSTNAKAVVSHVLFDDEDQLWAWRDQIVGDAAAGPFSLDPARNRQLRMFEQLAQQMSQCDASRSRNGSLGEITPGSLVGGLLVPSVLRVDAVYSV
jgi:hypothetical protein